MIALPLAITRGDVGDYLSTLLYLYVALIFVRILVSWIRSIPYNRWLNAFLTFVNDLTNPYLNLFRRFVPMVRFGGGGLDLSPMIAVFVLLIFGGLLVGLVEG